MTTNAAVEVIVDAHSDVGESPRWDARTGRLLWVDITAGTVRVSTDDGVTTREHQLGRDVGFAAWWQDEGALVGLPDGVAELDLLSGAVRPVAMVEADDPTTRMNDGTCDPTGALWAGTMAYDATAPRAALYRLGTDGAVTTVLREVTVSNGIGWSPDGTRMYYADSPTGRVDVIDVVDLETGTLGSRRPFARFEPTLGVPDGLAVDAEGAVWVAVFGGGQVRRYTPDGTLDRVVAVPVANVTACTFGGDDLATLYITTARHGRSPEELAREPLAGALFAHHPGVAGLPGARFGG